MVTPFEIAGHKIGPGQPCFIIAEAGVNHNGRVSQALALVDAAKAAGANAVKFQTFVSENLVVPEAPKAAYQKETTDAQESQLAMLKRLELSFESFREIYAYCRANDILFLSTPFDEVSADFLGELGVAAFKIPSGEITNLPLIAHVARKGRPLIVSTGMANLGEVEAALNTIAENGAPPVAVLQCVSNYPADPADINLRAMQTMQNAFGVPIGYSDHTLGTEVALAAVALGACIVEKHFTLDRNLPGPDHQASLEPAELTALIKGIRIVESALGDGRKLPTVSERDTAAVARKSLVAACDIKAGTVLAENMVALRRPGTGLPPAMRAYLIGQTVRHDIASGTLLSPEMFS